MEPQTQSVCLQDDLFLTIKPLSDGEMNKVSFETKVDGEPAQPVPIPADYKLVYDSNLQV